MRRFTLESPRFVAIAAFFVFLSGISATEPESGIRGTLENDVFISDEFYTNGLRMDFLNGSKDEGSFLHVANPARWMFAALRPLFGLREPFPAQQAETARSDSLTHLPFLTQSTYSVGLDTYTPSFLIKSDISYGDRPYASRAYLGSSFESHDSLRSLSVFWEASALGPMTGSDQGQTTVHRITGNVSTPPEGWDFQMPAAGGLDVGFDYTRRVFLDESENSSLGFRIQPRLGMIHTELEAGLEYRTGVSLEHWKTLRRITGSETPVLQFFVRPSLRYVAYDATLEGPMGYKMNIYQENQEEAYRAFGTLTPPDADLPSDPLLREMVKREIFKQLYLERNFHDYRYNLVRFQYLFYNNNPAHTGEQILIYETLFRETNPYIYEGYLKDNETMMLVISSIITEKEPLTPENLYFWNATLNRKDGEGLPPLAKWIAFDKLAARSSLSPHEKIVVYAALFNGRRLDHRPYGVVPVRTVFENEMGFSAGWRDLRATLSWTGQSDTFRSVYSIRDFHSWWRVAATLLL